MVFTSINLQTPIKIPICTIEQENFENIHHVVLTVSIELVRIINIHTMEQANYETNYLEKCWNLNMCTLAVAGYALSVDDCSASYLYLKTRTVQLPIHPHEIASL